MEQQGYDEWYVLSAKYGLIRQQDVIEPYELTLNNMKAAERKTWSELVLRQVQNMQLDITEIDFYAGEKYRLYLIPDFKQITTFRIQDIYNYFFISSLSFIKSCLYIKHLACCICVNMVSV
ncbi:DUF6884 domain-containing protein [Neobacillus soli]|uniref:DUF6884 domain-containing protein n=1 Tax=Neobacillus soli TaxID=220688 RepID=UPI00350E48D9